MLIKSSLLTGGGLLWDRYKSQTLVMRISHENYISCCCCCCFKSKISPMMTPEICLPSSVWDRNTWVKFLLCCAYLATKSDSDSDQWLESTPITRCSLLIEAVMHELMTHLEKKEREASRHTVPRLWDSFSSTNHQKQGRRLVPCLRQATGDEGWRLIRPCGSLRDVTEGAHFLLKSEAAELKVQNGLFTFLGQFTDSLGEYFKK